MHPYLMPTYMFLSWDNKFHAGSPPEMFTRSILQGRRNKLKESASVQSASLVHRFACDSLEPEPIVQKLLLMTETFLYVCALLRQAQHS